MPVKTSAPYAGELAETAHDRPPIQEKDWPYPVGTTDHQGRPANGWWVKVTFDLETGDITAEPSTGHQHPHIQTGRTGETYVPGEDAWLHGYGWSRWPRRLIWLHGMWPMNRSQVAEMLDWVKPHAQALLDALIRLPGGGYDWTRQAIAQFWHIKSIVDNLEGAKFHEVRGELKDCQTRVEGVVTFHQVTTWYPHLVDPAWATLDDDALDEVALRLTQAYPYGGPAWIPWGMEKDIAERAHWGEPIPPGCARGHYTVYVVAARAGLRALRDRAVEERAGMPAESAQRWLYGGSPAAQRWLETLTAHSTDAEVAQLGLEVETAAAEQDQVALTGTEGVMLARRKVLRQSFRELLGAVGLDTKQARLAYAALRARREAMLAQVIGWNDPDDRNPDGSLSAAELGRLASCTRQAVAQLAERLEQDEEAAS